METNHQIFQQLLEGLALHDSTGIKQDHFISFDEGVQKSLIRRALGGGDLAAILLAVSIVLIIHHKAFLLFNMAGL